MSKAAHDHQVDTNDVEPPAVTRAPTTTTATGFTKTTSPDRSENIVSTGANGPSEYNSAGGEAKGIEKGVDKTPRLGSKGGSSERSSSKESPMAVYASLSEVVSLAEGQKPHFSAPTEGFGLATGGSNVGEGLRRDSNVSSISEDFIWNPPRTDQRTRTTPAAMDQQEERRNAALSSRGERRFSVGNNHAHHGAKMSFDATGALDDFTRSLTGSRGAAVETEHFQRQVIRQGATTSSGDGNHNNPMFMMPYAPGRPGLAAEELGSGKPHHGPTRSFDANANVNLQSTWYQVPPPTRDRGQDGVPRTQRAPGQRRPSSLPREEQPWHQIPQSSERMYNNRGIDRIGGSSGGAFMGRALHTPEPRHMRSEEHEEPSPADKKRKRTPYRCKKCGQMKNKHECPLKNSDVETRGSQTSELPPGTVFEANDVPLPAANGSNVFYAKQYTPRLQSHDGESGPFQHSMDAKTTPVPRKTSTVMAAGGASHHRGPPEDSYSHGFPSISLRGVGIPATTTGVTGNAVGVVTPVGLAQGNAVGVVTPLGLGQDDRLIYRGSGSGGGDGGGGSAQQGQERSQWHGDRNTGLQPPPSARQWTSDTAGKTAGRTSTTGKAGNSWPPSVSDSRPPGGRDPFQCTTDEDAEGAAEDGDLSFRRFAWSNSALSLTRPASTMPVPPPRPDIDRWRRDNPEVQQRPPSVSIALTPRLESLERIIFSEGFTKTSLGPPPVFEKEQGGEEGKEAGGNDEAGTARI